MQGANGCAQSAGWQSCRRCWPRPQTPAHTALVALGKSESVLTMRVDGQLALQTRPGGRQCDDGKDHENASKGAVSDLNGNEILAGVSSFEVSDERFIGKAL